MTVECMNLQAPKTEPIHSAAINNSPAFHSIRLRSLAGCRPSCLQKFGESSPVEQDYSRLQGHFPITQQEFPLQFTGEKDPGFDAWQSDRAFNGPNLAGQSIDESYSLFALTENLTVSELVTVILLPTSVDSPAFAAFGPQLTVGNTASDSISSE